MEEWISFLQNRSEILTGAVLVVLGLILAITLLRILRQIKRLNRSLSSITKNIQAYMDVILQEEPQTEEAVTEGQQAKEMRQNNDAKGESPMEREHRKQEEEEVFNAVLQEYFS